MTSYETTRVPMYRQCTWDSIRRQQLSSCAKTPTQTINIDMRFHIPWCAHCLYHAKVMMSSHPINGIVIVGTARLIMSSPSRTDLGCLTWANQIQVCWLGCHQSKWFGVTSLIEPVLVGQSTRTGSVWSRWLGSIQFYGLALIRFVGRV